MHFGSQGKTILLCSLTASIASVSNSTLNFLRTRTPTHVHTCIHMCTHAYPCAHTHTHVHTRIHMCTYTFLRCKLDLGGLVFLEWKGSWPMCSPVLGLPREDHSRGRTFSNWPMWWLCGAEEARRPGGKPSTHWVIAHALYVIPLSFRSLV